MLKLKAALQTPPFHHSTTCEHRRDWDVGRMRVFREAVGAAMKEKFESVYGDQQVHLQILGTHPKHQRMGAASTLLRFGIQKAQDRGLPVTLFASPMGQPLYASFGFESRGTVNIQVQGEKEHVSVVAMALEPHVV
jgi:GNAT superfamily N-acetyltransferase